MRISGFIILLILPLFASAQESKVEMANYILRNIHDGEVYRNTFSMLENDAKDTKGWHDSLFGFCRQIFAQDSIPDDELSFAELTLESLASSEQTPLQVAFNSSGILGNVAFNTRDYDYLELNINRMEKTAKSLGNSEQLLRAIAKLKERREIIKGYAVPFRERMEGSWVSAQVNFFGEPDFFIDIMPDSIRINPFKNFYSAISYDKEGNIKPKDQFPENGTKEIVESPDRRQLAAFFGYSKLDKGNPMLASAIASASEQFSGSLTRSIAYRNRYKPYSAGATFSSVGADLVGALGMVLAASLSETVNTTTLRNVYLTEIVPGIMRMDLEMIKIVESSQSGTKETHYPRSLYLYKITPADGLIFTSYSKEKFKEPYTRDMCAMPRGVEDPEAYRAQFNRAVLDSIEARREMLDSIFSPVNNYGGHYKASAYANYFMREPLAKAVLNRVGETPEELFDENTLLEINRDVVYRSKNQDIISGYTVEVDGFEGRDNARFEGVYANKFDCGIYDRPMMLLQLLKEEARLPNGEPVFWRTDMDNVAKDLQKNLYPVNGVMTWEKNGKQYSYEGDFYNRKFHGNGKLTEDGVVVHEGLFEKGKPVVPGKK